MRALQALDPEGVTSRKKKYLKRRVYINKVIILAQVVVCISK